MNNTHISFFIMFMTFAIIGSVDGQTRTVGLMLNDTSKTCAGYTIFAPKHDTSAYLINNDGRLIHKWTASRYNPGQSVYLLESGNLLRSCMTKGKLGTGGGEGGRIEEYNWNDSLVWEFDFSTDTCMQHHDIREIPNGNIIMLAVEKRTYAEVIAAGFDTSKLQPDVKTKGMMLPDCVYEIRPTKPVGGNIVWRWRVWDHLIQDYDASKANYGVVRDHPELIDAGGDQKSLPLFWNHMNSIDYNPVLDQILLSVRGNSEVWIIDHSTTIAEAQGHTGGRYGKGGDLLYRWGNPICYGMGTESDQKLYQQHDAEWVRPGYPGEGNITVFDNGLGRNYSSIDEFTPPIDTGGNYLRGSGLAFSPSSYFWTYVATPPTSMYATAISGAQRLPNGNTLIDDGTHGTFIEVTQTREVVWKYICPVISTGPLNQDDSIPFDPTHPDETMNSVFRVYRYATDYPAFTGRNLTPGDYIEKNPTSVHGLFNQLPSSFKLFQNYPNPFNPSTKIRFELSVKSKVHITIYDILGRQIAELVNSEYNSGFHEIEWMAKVSSGIYFYRIEATSCENSNTRFISEKKMILLK